MYADDGSGWGGITYKVTTDGATRFSGTLDNGYNGVDYMCLEDGLHELVITGSDDAITWEFDDMYVLVPFSNFNVGGRWRPLDATVTPSHRHTDAPSH